ncbi:MAG TPA: TIGR03086 family metal-binding protein [Acidimicrobiales bacterium]|nr:TIGR03086 family metal-binding protein [Acidimicrobiales bacterium]
MIDLSPATTRLAAVVATVDDADLAKPTPCEDTTVGDLLDHIDGLAQAFTAAAAKTQTPTGSTPPPPPDAANLPADWRTAIPARLDELAAAWRDPEAWTGMTAAGGVDLPGEVGGMVALDEVLVHGWDLAVAIGRDFDMTDDEVITALGFVSQFGEEGTPGLFGPAVAVGTDASPKDTLLGRTGRDPAWTPA